MSPHIAAERVGFLFMMTIVGMGFGGWSSGWIYDVTGSYSAAFVHGIAWNVLNVGIIFLILLRTRSSGPFRAVSV